MKTKTIDKDKLRGGYYTPVPIAKFLSCWGVGINKNIRILEPSMGDGVFILEVAKSLNAIGVDKKSIGSQIYGIELFESEVKKAKQKLVNNDFLEEKFNLYTDDFFQTYKDKLEDKKFDLIIGNPPFIRYQNFPETQRDIATRILKEHGFNPNKLTNAWLFFLLCSTQLLSENGKIAMVIPAELLQVKYAHEARIFLSEHFGNLTLITFKKLVFENIQQEVVLILGEKKPMNPKGINIIEMSDIDELEKLGPNGLEKYTEIKPINHAEDKWTQYFLSSKEIKMLRSLSDSPKLKKLGDYVDVDVGIVTGNNDYFVLRKDSATENKLINKEYLIPLVGRSTDLNGGILFKKTDWEKAYEGNKPSLLMYLNSETKINTDKNLLDYIKVGEKAGVNLGYKCSIRKEWYKVPSVWIPEAFLYRQIHQYPKLVINEAKAVSTDTIHRLKIKTKISPLVLSAGFINSLTFAFSEITGRSYGGGVLELEPNEAEQILIPTLENFSIDHHIIDELLRKGEVEKALDIVDEALLIDLLGFDKKVVSSLREIWRKLSNRRLNRK